MKNKYIVAAMLIGTYLFALTGCSQKSDDITENTEQSESENTENTSSEIKSTEYEAVTEDDIANIINNVTADELKSINIDYDTARNEKDFKDTDFVVIDKSEKDDVVLYGLYCCKGMVLRVGDDVCPIDEWWLAPRIVFPKLYVQDLDNDNEQEYIIKTHVKTGTGVSGEDLYVIEHASDKFIVREFEEEDWHEQLLSHISWKYDDEWDILSTYVDGEPSGAGLLLSKYLEENQWTFDSLVFGAITEFISHDDKWYLWVSGGTCFNEVVMPLYEYTIDALAPISYEADGTFSLGQIELSAKNNDIYKNEDVEVMPELVANVISADVTHDGVNDSIVTSISYISDEDKDKTWEELYNQGGVCHIRVYDGNGLSYLKDDTEYAQTGGYAAEYALWEKELADAHAGNGQVYLYEKDGLSFIMEAQAYGIQETADFYYTVFSLDEYGRIFKEEHDAYSFDTHLPDNAYDKDKMQGYADDFEKMLKQSKLIAVTDVDTPARIAADGKEYTYDVSEIWKIVEEQQISY